MNFFLKKAAAFLAAGLMATAGVGAECFAEGAKLTWEKVELKLEASSVAKPTFTVKGAKGWRRIKLSTSTPGAVIYYTKDGTKPTTKSKKSNGGYIKISKQTKIRAIAVKDGVTSSVMTKTFSVNTLLGDVTGDGVINSNDYARLKNYLAKNTEYICKDNADCTGNGSVNTKDLTVLKQYLDGKISSLPSDPLVTVKKPTATITKIYGGKTIELATSTSGAYIYYTTDGSDPTPNSTRYTSPFTLSSTADIKAAAFKDGSLSAVRSFTVTVDKTQAVQADKSTSTTYEGDVSVVLSSSTPDARIRYTTDGTDPKTSNSAVTYSNAIKLSKDTTLMAYAQSKGYVDSEVTTYYYKVNASFNISGYVWDDTASAAVTANGTKASTESGISGITVYLIDAKSAVKDAPSSYVLKTTTDSAGNYSFNNVPKDANYKVVFEYNYQKYRAYNSIMSGGNQALPYQTIDPITVRENGAYIRTNNSENLANSVTKYNDATNSTYYKMLAVTNNTYSSTATDVNFGLISKNYGILDVSISVSGQDTTNKTIQKLKKLTYTITLTNNSPMTINSLSDANLTVYISRGLTDTVPTTKNMATVSTNFNNLNNGYTSFIFTNFIPTSGLEPGKSAIFQVEGVVDNVDAKAVIECYAEVTAYRFSTNCYDYYSAPGNLTIGNPRERDEAAAEKITVVNGSADKTLTTVTGSISVARNETNKELLIVAKNCKNINEVYFLEMTNQTIATYITDSKQLGDDLYIWFYVTGLKPGATTIPVMYNNNIVYLNIRVM